MDYEIVWVRGHVEVYDWAGRFCFSADNEREALEELGLTACVSHFFHFAAGRSFGRPAFCILFAFPAGLRSQ